MDISPWVSHKQIKPKHISSKPAPLSHVPYSVMNTTNGIGVHARNLGFVFSPPSLFPTLTIMKFYQPPSLKRLASLSLFLHPHIYSLIWATTPPLGYSSSPNCPPWSHVCPPITSPQYQHDNSKKKCFWLRQLLLKTFNSFYFLDEVPTL